MGRRMRRTHRTLSPSSLQWCSPPYSHPPQFLLRMPSISHPTTLHEPRTGTVAARLNAPKTKKTGDCDEPDSQSSSVYVCGVRPGGERGTSQCTRTQHLNGHVGWNAAASSAQGGISRWHATPCSAQSDRSVCANAGWDAAAGPAQGGAARWHATPGATQAAGSRGLIGGPHAMTAGQTVERSALAGEKPVILLLDLCYDLRQ
jgi:hypothetical protein